MANVWDSVTPVKQTQPARQTAEPGPVIQTADQAQAAYARNACEHLDESDDIELDLAAEQKELEADAKSVVLDLAHKSPLWHTESYGLRIIGVSSHRANGLRGNFVSSIQAGSPAELCLELSVGDEVIGVNGVYIRNMLHREALALLKLSPNPMHLTVISNDAGWAAFQHQAYSSAARKQSANPAIRADTANKAAAPHPTSVHLAVLSSEENGEAANVHKGIVAFLSGDMKIAEMCFLEALHVKLDDDVADAIIQASKLPTPAQAQAACNRIVALQKKQKAGVNYLVGVAMAAQARPDDRRRAQKPLVTAVKQCMEWKYDEGMMVDPEDADFHHSIAVALVAQNKHEIASFAYLEAIRRKPANKIWRAELAKITAKYHAHPNLHVDPVWRQDLGLVDPSPPRDMGSGQRHLHTLGASARLAPTTPRQTATVGQQQPVGDTAAAAAADANDDDLAVATPVPEASFGDISAVADDDWHTPSTGKTDSVFSDELDEIGQAAHAAHDAHAALLTLAAETAGRAIEKIKLTPPSTLRAESPSNSANVRLTQMQEIAAREQLELDLAAADAASPAPSPLSVEAEADASWGTLDPRGAAEVTSQPELAGRDGTVTPPAMEPVSEPPLSPSVAETLTDPKRKVSWA